MIRLIVVVLGCLLSLSVVRAEDLKLAPRHVSVTGTAVTRVQPDTVVWHINILRQDKELAKARSACDETVKKILALQTELKLKPEEVQTGHLSIQKVYDRDQAGNQTTFRHFQIQRDITLRQRDTSRFDDVLTRLVEAADVQLSYTLESSDYTELRTKTRLDAVKAARQKATAMTELLGAKLGKVLRIAEPQERWDSGFGVGNSISSMPRQVEPDQAPGTFAPGAIEVKVSIEVAFEVE